MCACNLILSQRTRLKLYLLYIILIQNKVTQIKTVSNNEKGQMFLISQGLTKYTIQKSVRKCIPSNITRFILI